MQPSTSNAEAQKGQSAAEGDGLVMTSSQKRFYVSEECLMARETLQNMVDNPTYNTDSDYFSGSTLGFVDRHLYYLSTHAGTNVEGYLSNLRLMTSARLRK